MVEIPSGGSFLDTEKIVNEMGLTEGMRIGDFGSGSGYFAIAMAQRVGENGQVAAIDIQQPPLETVMGKANALGLKNIVPIRGNLEVVGGSSLPADSQDWVVLVNILFQSTKKEDIFKEASRVLKSGGRLIIVDWKKGVGGGPPDNLRTDQAVMQQLVVGQGFAFEKNLDAGQFHYGMVFKK